MKNEISLEERIKEVEKMHRQVTQLMTEMPRMALLDVCPVCSRPILVRHGHSVCTSGMCRNRPIEDCC